MPESTWENINQDPVVVIIIIDYCKPVTLKTDDPLCGFSTLFFVAVHIKAIHVRIINSN